MEKGKKIIKQKNSLCAVYALANFLNNESVVEAYESGKPEDQGPIDFVVENDLLRGFNDDFQLNYIYLDTEHKINYERFKELVHFEGDTSEEFVKPYALLLRVDIAFQYYHRVWIFIEKSEFGTFIHLLDTMNDTMIRISYDKFVRSYWIVGIAGIYSRSHKGYFAIHKEDLKHLI